MAVAAGGRVFAAGGGTEREAEAVLAAQLRVVCEAGWEELGVAVEVVGSVGKVLIAGW